MVVTQAKSKLNSQINKAKQIHLAGNLSQAQKQYEKLLKKSPGNRALLSLLGGVLLQQKKYDRAVDYLKRAIAKDSSDADLRYNLGLGYFHREQYENAIAAFKQAVEMNFDHDRAFYMMGKAYLLLDSNKYRVEALQAYLRDIEITDRIDSAVMSADLLHEEGRHADARGMAKKALEKDPANEIALWVMAKTMVAENYGNTTVDVRKAEPIVKIASLILQLHPGSWRGHHVMAEALTMLGEDGLAVEHYEKLKELKPTMAAARTSAGVLMLRQGRLKDGWEEIAFRKQHGEKLFGMNVSTMDNCPAPRWQGELEPGKQLLVASEQGIGDQMLHCQILKDVLDAGMKVHMTCTPKILNIMERSLPQVSFYPSNEPVEEEVLNQIDYKAELLDLGKYLRSDIKDFKQPYYFLSPDQDLVRHFKTKYQQFGNKLKIGIAWKSTSKSVGTLKSTELKQWRHLLSIPGAQFISIQYGDIADDIADAKARFDADIFVDDFDPFKDIEKAVAQIAALDLVVSVSNAAVHMSGQLQVPTWVLLNHRTLWHWFNDTEDTVWYQNYKLYRQRQLESWDPVFERITHDLNGYVQNLKTDIGE